MLRRCEPLLPGLLVSGVVASLSSLGAFIYLEDLASDALTRLRGPQPWSDELVVIGIDDPTFQQLGMHPLPRKYYADLLQKLMESGNRLVAFDILMSEPNPDDKVLAEAMAEHGGVILAATISTDGQPLNANSLLSNNAQKSGRIDESSDFDGITRRHRLSINNRLSLAAATAAVYSATGDVIALPALPDNQLLLNWPGPVERIKFASLIDVLDGKIPPDQLTHKIILVGVTGTGTDRDLRTPFDNDRVGGVYVYAAVLHNLLEENWLRIPSQWLVYLFIFLSGPLMSGALQGRSFLRQVGLWVLGASLWVIICFGARFQNYALPVAMPIVLLSLTEGLIIFTDRLRSSAMLQARNEFLGTMSHELRTPLNAIIGISEMMQETPLDPRQREFSETIQNSSQALLALINDVLDFSKIEAGRLVLEEHPVNLRNSIEESLDIVATRATNKPLDMVYMVDPKTPPVIISDPIRLRQILLNLLSNAVKFTDHGEVAVVVQPASSDDLGAPVTRWSHPSEQSILLHFAVRDTGIGIPEDRLAQIFEPFRQASSSTTRKYG
ncbi:CHASE2 domain-containing protein, partial [Leptolyngbya cf. ectocarpi LEGE 11479]